MNKYEKYEAIHLKCAALMIMLEGCTDPTMIQQLTEKHAAYMMEILQDMPKQKIKELVEAYAKDEYEMQSNAVIIGDIVLAKPMNVVELADTIFKPCSTPNGYETN